MTFLRNLYDRCKRLCVGVVGKIDNIMNAAFPDPSKKKTFLALVVVLEILLFYLIAVLDVGIWVGDCTPFGIIAGYWTKKRFYPIWLFVILSAVLIALVYYGIKRSLEQDEDRGFEISESNVYGKAKEITRKELEAVADIVPKNAALSTIFGQLDLTENNLITMKPNANSNNNIICFGSPGSGKTFSFVIPFILQAIRRGESVLCTDTKGDLWAQTVEVARYYGYTIRRLDFRNPEFSDGWDVLSELRHSDVRAQVATNIIMENTGNEKDTFLAAEGALLKALLLYTERNNAIPESERTLYNALTLLSQPLDALDKIFADCVYDSSLSVAHDAYIPFSSGSPNLRGNVINGLFSRLSILTSPPVRHLTSTPDVDMTLPAQRPCIYYCNMSDQHEAMKFLGSLFFSFGFLDLVDFADAQPSRKCPVRVNFLVEEAMNLGKIPNLSKYLNTCRSRNVDIQLCVQNISQLVSIYDDLSESILSACATHLCYGFNDKSTSELFEWRSGEATVKVKTEQHQIVESPVLNGFNYSTGDGRRQVYTSNDLMTMPARRVFIVWQRQNCLMTHTFGMNRHIEYIEGRVKEISTETHIPLNNVQAKQYLRAMEEQRVLDYQNWLQNGGDPWTSYTCPEPQHDGPARGTPPPQVTPYPELEKMALAFGAQAEPERSDALLREMQQEGVPATYSDEPMSALPSLDDAQWEEDLGFGDEDAGSGFEEMSFFTDDDEPVGEDTSFVDDPSADMADDTTSDTENTVKPSEEAVTDTDTSTADPATPADEPASDKNTPTITTAEQPEEKAKPPHSGKDQKADSAEKTDAGTEEPIPAEKPKKKPRTRKKNKDATPKPMEQTPVSDAPKLDSVPVAEETTQQASDEKISQTEAPPTTSTTLAPDTAQTELASCDPPAEKQKNTKPAEKQYVNTSFAGDLGKPGFVAPAYNPSDFDSSDGAAIKPGVKRSSFRNTKTAKRQTSQPPKG